jgi:hypothetical protein
VRLRHRLELVTLVGREAREVLPVLVGDPLAGEHAAEGGEFLAGTEVGRVA